jgi:membrane-associated HD superfamily phosphohydrolase
MSALTETTAPEPDEIDLRQSDLPPVARLATVTLVLVVIGGIYMAAQINRSVTLVPPLILAIAAAVVLLVDLALLARIPTFAWTVFFRVFGWALLVYLTIAGILEFVFVYDHTPGRQLALFTAMLVLFAVTVPLILAFSVARYQPAPE